ncbi:MAG TPA: DUF1990 domain-containing protein [Bryobacteraceae bacterium]|nr:DUF1990 domain-containing protein [Bryobacteraceae bacterium]
MFSLREPRQLRRQGPSLLSYARSGMTREPVEPRGFSLDEYCVRVGSGRADFARGPEAVREWKMFDLGWLRVDPPGATIVEGTQVAVVIRHFGFWSVNWSQIVYIVDEDRRFGFAYGTLMDHAESGEERFTVTLRPDGSVWYEIRAL